MARTLEAPSSAGAAVDSSTPVRSWTFKFRSNVLSLNFVATMAGPRSRPHGVERWTGPSLLREWFVLAGLPVPVSDVTDLQLDQARDLREAIYRLATLELRSAQPSRADIDLVNYWQKHQAHLPQLDGSGRGHVLPEALPFAELMSLIAADAIDLLTGDHGHRIKECASDKCPILFVDRSHAGNRRWCSERPCGFQASSKAYRQRKNTTFAPGP